MYVSGGRWTVGRRGGLNGKNRLLREDVPLDWGREQGLQEVTGSPPKSRGSQVTESLPCWKRG